MIGGASCDCSNSDNSLS